MFSNKSSDRRFLVGVFLILAVLSSLPYLYGWLQQTTDLAYLGLHGFAPGDTFVYFSYLWQVRDGHFLFTDLYTTEASVAPILNTFWAVTGWLGNLLRISIPLTFHLARLLMIPALLYVLWIFLFHYLADDRARRWGVGFAVFASGVSGYLLPMFQSGSDLPGYYHLPLDLWVAEANVFTSALHSGHMLAALALIVAIFTLFLVAVERQQWRQSWYAGVAALALFSFHPFHVPLIFSVLGVFWLLYSLANKKIRWDIFGRMLVVFLVASPVLIYYAWALVADPVTAGRALRNLTLTPAWYLLLLSYGFLIPGAVIGGYRIIIERVYREPRWLLLLTWLAMQTVLIMCPFISFQRRMVTGLQIPLIVLTVYGWPIVKFWLSRVWPKALHALTAFPLAPAIAFMFVFGFSNLVNFANDLGLMRERNPLVFWPREEVAAITALRPISDAASVVLADAITGYIIPALTGRRVVAGHQDVETIDYGRKRLEIAWFFQGGGNEESRRAFLARYGVTHIFAGPRELAGGAVSFDVVPYLNPVFANTMATIYRVQ